MPEEPSTTSSSTPRAKKPVRPRAGIQRRTQAEREDFKRKEAEREAERKVADTTPAAKTPTRGSRGGSRRGGVAIHQSEKTQNAATGIFGAGTGLKPARSKAPVDLGVSEALDEDGTPKPSTATGPPTIVDATESRAKSKTAGGRSSNKKDEEELIPISDDDHDGQPTRDIERIWISSDEDEDVIISRKGKQRHVSKPPKMSFGLRPVRAARQTSDSIEDDKPGRTSNSVKVDDNQTVIDIDADEMVVDEPVATVKKDPPSSPEQSKRLSKKVDNRVKDAKTIVETVEERAERLRMSGDIDKLREEFLSSNCVSDGDVVMDHGDNQTETHHTGHDRMFLFQLPPLVPQLFDSTTKASLDDAQDVHVKAEPEISATAMEAEPGQKDNEKVKDEPPPTVFTSASTVSERFPQGLVGKLSIHKSGKVTLDWGGTDMEVRYGTEVDFLQNVVCVESHELPDVTDVETQERIGKAYALGQVEKKMVLVPDWGKLYA